MHRRMSTGSLTRARKDFRGVKKVENLKVKNLYAATRCCCAAVAMSLPSGAKTFGRVCADTPCSTQQQQCIMLHGRACIASHNGMQSPVGTPLQQSYMQHQAGSALRWQSYTRAWFCTAAQLLSFCTALSISLRTEQRQLRNSSVLQRCTGSREAA